MKPPGISAFVLGVFLVLCFIPSVFGVGTSDLSHFAVRTWQTDNGLPHNAVTAVLQTRDGYLWIGTWQGLARFDGIRFTVFTPQNTPGLKGPNVRFLYESKDGTLWIGTQDDGVTSLSNGEFVHDPFLLDASVRSMVETRDGSLWFGTTKGLARCSNNICTWLSRTNGLIDDMVLALCEDKSGDLWIGTGGGLVSYKQTFGKRYDATSGLSVNSVRALYCDDQNSLWIGTGGGGVSLLQNGELKTFGKREGLPDLFVNFIFNDHRNELRVGTVSGVARWQDNRFVAETNSEGTAYDFCMTEDREGGLWLGTKEGLSQLLLQPFKSITQQSGLSHNNVTSVREDSRGTIWLTTWGGGLDSWNDHGVGVYNHPTNGLYDLLLSTCETKDGTLWIGSDFDGGLFQMRDGAFAHYGKNEGLTDPVIRALCEDSKGSLWVGTGSALFEKTGNTFKRFTKADGLVGDTVRCLHEDRYGNLWIGTPDGLTRKNERGFQSFTMANGLSDNAVLALHEDREGTLWIGSANGGLDRLRTAKEYNTPPQITSYRAKDGLFSDNILEILEDDRDNLWISCYSGVYRVAKKQLDALDQKSITTVTCTSFGKIDGMSSIQCNGVSKPAGWKGKDGRLWFPTTRGVVAVDPQSIRDNDPPPLVIVEGVTADKQMVFGQDADNPTRKRANNVRQKPNVTDLVIQPGRGELEFEYTALSFRAPEKNRFKYRLEGFDTEWFDVGTRRTAFYNNLYPGQYRFRVIACNSDGVWNTAEATIGIVLLPHIWQTKWFLALIGITAALGIAGSVRYFTWQKMQKQLLRLEEQHAVEKERARIARDMHDDFGARLTEISVLSEFVGTKTENTELKPHVRRISNAAREMVRNLDALVWAINPKNDSVNQLALYIGEYIEMFFNATNTRYKLEIADDLPATALSSEQRHSLFLVIKESLNNIVKHSAATEVILRLAVEDNILRISIEDNGTGFESKSLSPSANGLANMRKRIEDIGGKIEILSDGRNGTTIKIEIKLEAE